jgi:hypothetical protein
MQKLHVLLFAFELQTICKVDRVGVNSDIQKSTQNRFRLTLGGYLRGRAYSLERNWLPALHCCRRKYGVRTRKTHRYTHAYGACA